MLTTRARGDEDAMAFEELVVTIEKKPIVKARVGPHQRSKQITRASMHEHSTSLQTSMQQAFMFIP